ncbi:hypothetical protein CPU12_02240 [Malaciobacter molluscorum LMG 25693]|uniref:Ribosome association toxin RatA n=1 Tax=Malaciobacter molluscorum LMG 25693 TaxID=870501 RepID=A0A2G1DKR6_9BACT|nr:SRPBCC family protein [Malaciobacter molluscorum]AXX92666.1 hypothetical protein AMOL_1701 [Malaciobacter molluscorum LMG 25693]PHO19087.1 hypothetical protein CPU12_02240 [Malaciobacter molluscorum LMG 25693]RXJ97393.1 hypothetical protein CRV00_00725 [Malaciobacter molluscorum]
MQIYTRTIYIDTTLDDIFDFHLDTNNLVKITPPNIKVKLLNENFIPKEGSIMNIKVTKNFISLNWSVKIKKLERPKILIDIAEKSIFKYWEHQHIFEERGNRILLKDVVRYEVPFGFLGKLVNYFIYRDIDNMFKYRQDITKKILEGKIQ